MKHRVIARDWAGNALDRWVVGVGKRVFYISMSPGSEGVGFPKETIYPFSDDLIGKRLTAEEWSKLKPLELAL